MRSKWKKLTSVILWVELEMQMRLLKLQLFLLGEESSWMTGRILQLDGGIGNLKT